MPVVDQPGDQLNDLRDMLGRLRMNGCRSDAERFGVDIILGDKAVGKLSDRNPFFIGTPDHFVVDIREILDEGYLIAFPFQLSSQHVKSNKRPCVSDMEIIIYRWAAGIDPCLPFMDRLKFFLFPCQAVIDLHILSCLLYVISCSGYGS